MPVLRDVFLGLSTNSAMRQFVVNFPLSRRVSRRFVAGETLEEAIHAVQELNRAGMDVSFDQLGESVTTQAEACQARDGYLRAVDAIAANKVSSHISLKLTQMGLDLSRDLCLDNVRQIVARAKAIGTFVRVDMEDSPRTQETLDLFKILRGEFDNVGIVIQAYLYRSAEDMRNLKAMGANVRLCKGAYGEPASVAFPKKSDVDANYIELARAYLEPGGGAGVHLALATHDVKIIDWAKTFVAEKNIAKDRYEFQMLYGIRSDLHRQIAAEGHVMRVYVPYGTHWYPYLMRRVAERPANAVFLLGSLFH